MLKERLAVTQDVVAHLADAERTNDLAIISTAKLAAALLEARMKINLAAEVGQDAFDAVAATFQTQAASRRQLVEAHQALNDVKDRIGLRTVAVGGAGNKEPLTGGLRVVESQAA